MPAWLSKVSWVRRPLGRPATVALALLVCLAPAWLFADPLESYYIYGDDWEFLTSSRTFSRTMENLLTPHNVHIVPVWRLVSWTVVARAGRLANLQPTLAATAYGTLAAVMLLAGHLVARETGRAGLGVATMVGVGTTSVMMPAGTWFSASQAAGAGFGILATLWYLQGWRRSGGVWRLVMAVLAAWAAGGSWTVGHAAGPVGAIYLWADGRPRCRKAAVVPFLASVVAAGTFAWLAWRGIAQQSTISFHGRSTEQAASPYKGALLTIQAIPERLILGDLGLIADTTFAQAVVLLLALAVAWVWSRRGNWRPSPLEWAGLAIVAAGYELVLTFRAYLPFSSLRGFVPWYDTIPHIGLALFAAGWWAGLRPPLPRGVMTMPTRGQAVGILLFQLALIVLHQPRVDADFINGVARMTPSEEKRFPIPKLRRLRAVYLADERAALQRRHLIRLEQSQAIARHRGIGRAALNLAVGRVLWPDPPVIDDADLLDLPRRGPTTDPATIRAAVGHLFAAEPEPRPPWLPSNEPWNPKPVPGR
jgi:hypothetical protein